MGGLLGITRPEDLGSDFIPPTPLAVGFTASDYLDGSRPSSRSAIGIGLMSGCPAGRAKVWTGVPHVRIEPSANIGRRGDPVPL
jgi:hypothetical protein